MIMLFLWLKEAVIRFRIAFVLARRVTVASAIVW
jgi:hypothetical protein